MIQWWKEDQLTAWLKQNAPGILKEYADHIPQDITETYFLDLPCWVERYHPEIVEEIRNMNKPQLTIMPQVVQAVEPSDMTKKIIHDAAEKAGDLQDYLNYNFGSCWYVELPRYINRLVERGLIEEAKHEIESCFVSGRIPQKILRDG